MERDKTALITLLTIDVALVSIMFLGLLRLRGRGGGMYGIVRLLWKQVRWWQFFALKPWCSQFPLMNFLFIRALFGSCLPLGHGSLQWRVSWVSCSLRSRTLYTAGVRFFGPEPYFLLSNLY